MTSRNVETARIHLFDAFNEHDLDRAMAGYAPDVRFVMHPAGTVTVGVAAIHAMFEGLFRMYPDVQAIIDKVIDAGDTVVFEFRIKGSNPATGETLHRTACDIVRFNAAGQIVSEDNYGGGPAEGLMPDA